MTPSQSVTNGKRNLFIGVALAILVLIAVAVLLKIKGDRDAALAAAQARYESAQSLWQQVSSLGKKAFDDESAFESDESDASSAGAQRHKLNDDDAMYALAKREQSDVSKMDADEASYESTLRTMFDEVDERYPNASNAARSTLATLQVQRSDGTLKWTEAINAITDSLHASVNGETDYSSEDVAAKYDASDEALSRGEATQETLSHEIAVMVGPIGTDLKTTRATLIAAGGKP